MFGLHPNSTLTPRRTLKCLRQRKDWNFYERSSVLGQRKIGLPSSNWLGRFWVKAHVDTKSVTLEGLVVLDPAKLFYPLQICPMPSSIEFEFAVSNVSNKMSAIAIVC